MLRTQNSPLHRSGSVLCGNLGRKANQDVHCSSLGLTPGSQRLELIQRSCEHNPSSHSTTMPSMRVTESNHLGYYSMPPMYALQEYALPTYCSPPSGLSGYQPAVDSGFVSNPYEDFAPALQSADNPTTPGVFYKSQQPPMPPAGPEGAISPDPEFRYHLCHWMGGPQCNGLAPGRNREMGEHLRVHHHFIGHERDPVCCEWQGCSQVMQRMNVARHIVSRHLLAAASCRHCGKRFSRPDVVGRHEKTCTGVYPAASNPASMT